MKEEKRNEKEKGITLIALVVTIVVLLILAGITINSILGDNGIIKKAKDAANKMNEATNNDLTVLNQLSNEMEKWTNQNNSAENLLPPSGPGSKTDKPTTWPSKEVTPIEDGSGNAVPLPNGFYYVGGNRTEGLVISDNSSDANKGTDYATTLIGNQFVWIPVADESALERTLFDESGKPTIGLPLDMVTEPYSAGYDTETTEFNIMKSQVLKYGGFYMRTL